MSNLRLNYTAQEKITRIINCVKQDIHKCIGYFKNILECFLGLFRPLIKGYLSSTSRG